LCAVEGCALTETLILKQRLTALIVSARMNSLKVTLTHGYLAAPFKRTDAYDM